MVPVRAALSDTTGERPLYVIADAFKDRHPFPDQVSSFLPVAGGVGVQPVCLAAFGGLHHSVQVPTIDWRTLVERYGRFDLVAIDAEGYDAEILQQIDMKASCPDIILLRARAPAAACSETLRTAPHIERIHRQAGQSERHACDVIRPARLLIFSPR